MRINKTRKILQDDIADFRLKAAYYKSLHLFEAATYAEHLAANIELALATLPAEEDQEIY